MGRPGGRDRRGGSRRRSCRVALVAGTTLLVLSCREDVDVLGPPPPLPLIGPPPQFVTSAVVPNEANVLSAVILAHVRYADSVAVRYGLAGATADRVTSTVSPAGDSVSVPVLGLLPDTVYTLTPIAYGNRRITTGEALTLRTGALPADLPSYATAGPDPSPGFVVFASGHYGIVIDNTGRVVWYRRFEYGAGLSFAAQPTGHYVARPATPVPTDPHPWVEIDPLGNVTRTLPCAYGLEPRLHDLILESDGSYWLMCDETRTMDLAAMGGVADARVTATAIQHVGADGTLLFSWTPFDHFDITDLNPASRAGGTVNWTHGNALDLDTDGNIVVSFRNLNEVTKIDTETGEVLWRLGGVRSQFTFSDGPTPAFARQHGVRLTSPRRVLLLDNWGDSLDSRAELYDFEPEQGVARLLASYGSAPAVSAQLGGSVQDLPGGRTLVSFGSAGRVEEYDGGGQIVWRIEGAPGYIFRAQRIRSLYAPGVGLPR